MKLLNIFKKITSTSSVTKKTNIQKMDTKQLSKVIGGSDIVGAAVIGGAVSKTTIPVGGVVVGGNTASGL